MVTWINWSPVTDFASKSDIAKSARTNSSTRLRIEVGAENYNPAFVKADAWRLPTRSIEKCSIASLKRR
jgi:hypothetical protein